MTFRDFSSFKKKMHRITETNCWRQKIAVSQRWTSIEQKQPDEAIFGQVQPIAEEQLAEVQATTDTKCVAWLKLIEMDINPWPNFNWSLVEIRMSE